MDSRQLTPCRLSDLGTIETFYFRGHLRTGHSLLVIRLEGTFANGPGDCNAFDLASAAVMAGLEAWQPWAAVLDLEGSRYEWGDRMENVLTAPRRWSVPIQPLRNALSGQAADAAFPYMVVVSPENREALEGLIREQMSRKPAELLSNGLEQALERLEERLANVGLV